MTTETELVAVQQCEFTTLMAAENFSMAWEQFVVSCSNWSTAFGVVLAVVGALITLAGVLIKLYRSFIKLNPESEKYKRKLEYYLNTHHPSDFDNVAVLSPEQEKAKRDAIALQKEIETYRSRNLIRIYELWLNRGLNKLRRFFDEQPILRNPSQSKSSVQQTSTLFTELLSEGSYKFCLILAFVYPLLFAFINVLISNEVVLAQFALFKFESNALKVIFIVGIALLFVLFWLGKKLDVKGGGWRLFAALCYLGAHAGAIVAFAMFVTALSVTFDVDFVGAYLIAFSFVFACVSFFSFAGLVTFVGAFAVAFSGVFTFDFFGVATFAFIIVVVVVAGALLNFLQKNERLTALRRQSYFFLAVLIYLVTCCLLVIKFGQPDWSGVIIFPIMLGILPFLNAPIDWLSLNFTRALSYLIADHHGKKRFLLGFLLVDIVGAIVFMALIIAVMLSVLSLANVTAFVYAAKPILDFNQIMPAMISADTASQYVWAHFMVLSTLIPTLLHLILVIVSVVLYPFGHAKKNMYDNFYQNQQHYAPIVMRHQQTQTAHAMVLGAVVLVIAAVAIMNFSWAGCGLWHYADWVLGVVDNGYQSPVGGDLLCF